MSQPSSPEVEQATERQNRAADPQAAAFVSAHAGSGKTHVLTGRVIRLLLEGTAPERILCLTYTRAAAAEMKTRIFERLSKWIDLPDEALREAIHEVTGGEVRFAPEEPLAHARRLFARALETPGGLKVQTIHAFCERLLQAFPVEAGLTPGFQVMDEGAARELIAEARRRVVAGQAELAGPWAAGLEEDLAIIAAHESELRFDELLGELMAHRRLLHPFERQPELLEAWRTALAARLGITPELTGAAIRQRWLAALDRSFLRRVAEHLAKFPGKTNDGQRGLLLRLAQEAEAGAAWNLSRGIFLKKDGQPKADSTLMTKTAAEAAPALAEGMADMREALHGEAEAMKGVDILAANMALLRAGLAVLATYEALKRRQGMVDYDDLIERTLGLLGEDNAQAQWVLYRLDGGIDHVLVDEAQDTAPAQWEIIRRLTAEFCAGEGAREEAAGRPRTVFAVGDFKQSIYSFQGAEPEAFRHMLEHFRACFTAAGVEFRSVDMNVSFRSAPAILKAVDEVLARCDTGLAETLPRHLSAWGQAPGLVELWVPEGADEEAEEERADPWRPPGRLTEAEGGRMRLARRMARLARELVERGTPVRDRKGRFRPARWSDILVLVRNRTTFMDAIITAMKQAGVPVAGADRLKVTDHIAVQDLMALGRFLGNRADDLSLACVLKSPLLRRDDGAPFTDEDIMAFRLGDGEEGAARSLWAQMRRARAQGAPCAEALRRLDEWWAEAGRLEPFDFYARVLGRDGGRRAFFARLGPEAAEPLDAFLDLARQFEMEHAAAPGGFLAWLEAAAGEVRREAETGGELRDEVRVMTVHGAKGLEAPIVLLPDSCSRPAEAGKARIIRVAAGGGAAAGAELPFWTIRTDARNHAAGKLLEEWRARELREHCRLLYVAMTRARDRLYIGGALDGRMKEPDRESWHAIVRRALFPDGEEDEHAFFDGQGQLAGWRLQEGELPGQQPADEGREQAEGLPPWARQAARRAPAGGRAWAAPSRLAEADGAGKAAPAALSPLEGAERGARGRYLRGQMIHRLLQYLPETPPRERRERALEWLGAAPRGLAGAEAEAIWDEVRAIMEDERLAPLFGPESRAEVPFAARIGEGEAALLVSGQIDRLAVLEDEVIVADYKTMRPAPARAKDVPQDHVAQLAVYGRAMEELWPEKRLRALVIFTATPQVVEIPQDMLRAALEGLVGEAPKG